MLVTGLVPRQRLTFWYVLFVPVYKIPDYPPSQLEGIISLESLGEGIS